MTFERSKTLSNILIRCLIAFDEIHNLYDFLDCVEKLWIHPTTQKIMTLSRVITYPMRVFDMVPKFSKVITLIKVHTEVLVHLKSPTPTIDYHYHHCHQYYLYLLFTTTTYYYNYYHYLYLLLYTTIYDYYHHLYLLLTTTTYSYHPLHQSY